MMLDQILAQAASVTYTLDMDEHPMNKWFHGGRVQLIGPWHFHDAIKWQALICPYNAGMDQSEMGRKYDRDVEGVGDTPQEALLAAIGKFTMAEQQCRIDMKGAR